MISDNMGNIYETETETKGNVTRITLKREKAAQGAEYIEFTDDIFSAKAVDDGYFVIADFRNAGSYLCRFTDKKDEEAVLKQNLMPIFGVKKFNFTALAVAVGMKSCFHIHIKVKDNKYSAALRFVLDKNEPYEDVSFEIHRLAEGADYNAMAREYRKYQLDRGACLPLAERIKSNPALAYAAEAVEIRIRMGWKPAPPKVLEQTAENEPEMRVACTFDRVKDIIDELKNQGVDKAQICLVGWNKSGHDGRWPQIFPVEEKLGGEKKLKELIRYAKDNGYQIVCHTNSTDWYSISGGFAKEKSVLKKADGSFSVNSLAWSGGTMYDLCPVKAYEIAKTELPKVAELGFSGLHYIDVMSVVPLRRCYDKNHPATEKDTGELYAKIGGLSHSLFGGFASEGAYDFAAAYLDYALYVSFEGEPGKLFDEEIPLWQLVYHGIILSNPSTSTVNYTVKGEKSRIKFAEYGGRPSFYFYSKFLEGSNQDDWLGKEDLVCDTDEQLRYSVSKIKEAYDEYRKTSYLQTEFMEKHCETTPGVFEVTYGNGDTVSYTH